MQKNNYVSAASRELTLQDRLSRLQFDVASKLLGEHGKKYIFQGGRHEVNLEDHVRMNAKSFELQLDGALAKIELDPGTRAGLKWSCSRCEGACEHLGAAFSLILEEKTALGLAAAPKERTIIENLSEKELFESALSERQERATVEKMSLESLDPAFLWTDYTVTNKTSGRTYRVALRGWERGDSFCSCPDFKKNTLGTCKHLFFVQSRARKRFPKAVQQRAYVQSTFAVCLKYGESLDLRLLAPHRIDSGNQKEVRKISEPFANQPVKNIQGLVDCISRLEEAGYPVVIYPDAEEYIQNRLIAARLRETVESIRKKPSGHPYLKNLLRMELLPYQLDGIAFVAGARRAVLADDMGLGKTIQGIGLAELLAREVNISRVLVICPASVKAQWRSEIERFSERSCQIVLGKNEDRARQYGSGSFFTICNYEQVLRDILSIERVRFDLIILDEGQRIKNWEAQTSRIVKSLRSTFALILSGTPLENRIDELFSVVEFIDDRRLGPAFRFLNRHRVTDEKGKVLGYRNLSDLRARLAPVLLRRTRASVMSELPERSTEIIRITPTEEQLDIHRGQMQIVNTIISKAYISEMDLLRLRKALLMCRMAADSTYLVDKTSPGFSSKIEELDTLLGRLANEKDRKIIIFSEWTRMLDLIEPILRKHKLEHVRLEGSVPQAKRKSLVDQFQKDSSCRVFLATNAGATGLNLQAANTVINVDLPWNPAVLEQRIARAHRMGQKRKVQVFILLTEETIEEKLLATLSAKNELARAALDVTSDRETVDLVSGVEELRRRLEVLLGRAPEAPKDVSLSNDTRIQGEEVARRERAALASGELLAAAFRVIEEVVPQGLSTDSVTQMAKSFRERFIQCTEPIDGGTGAVRLNITLPNSNCLDRLADSLAHLVTRSPVFIKADGHGEPAEH